MKPVWRYLIVGMLLLAVGMLSIAVGSLQRRLAHAQQQLLVLNYEASAQEYGRLESRARLAGLLPWLAGMRDDVRQQGANATYWQALYASLRPDPAEDADAERNPQMLLIRANAAYRQIASGESGTPTVQRLQDVLAGYAEVLKLDPWQFDAAFNYQFVARARNTLASAAGEPGQARGRGGKPAADSRRPPDRTRTLHGRAGAESPGLEMNEFKMIVPRQSDERQEEQEAGRGSPRGRKG
jgi:type II secretory pathway pseudopilin PulG